MPSISYTKQSDLPKLIYIYYAIYAIICLYYIKDIKDYLLFQDFA